MKEFDKAKMGLAQDKRTGAGRTEAEGKWVWEYKEQEKRSKGNWQNAERW